MTNKFTEEKLKEKLIDLKKQATTERSHYYVRSVIDEVLQHFQTIEEARNEGAKGQFYSTVKIDEIYQIPEHIMNEIKEEARKEEREEIKEKLVNACYETSGFEGSGIKSITSGEIKDIINSLNK